MNFELPDHVYVFHHVLTKRKLVVAVELDWWMSLFMFTQALRVERWERGGRRPGERW